MQQTIYFGRKKLLLTDIPLNDEQPSTTALFSGEDQASIQSAVDALQNGNTETAVIVHPDVDALFSLVKSRFKVIQAAGGLVQSDQEALLLIFRRGKWDLPKGKLDEGEDLETCAVREVEEETGLKKAVITRPLLVTFHTYYQDGELILKESHWYEMKAPQMDNLKPQTEEDIEQCIWVKPENINPYLEKMQYAVVDVLKAALPQLAPF